MFPMPVELVPAGAMAPGLLGRLREDLAAALRCPVWISREALDPAEAFDNSRQQYNAITMIQLLLASPGKGSVRMAVTNVDLFLPVFTHVFGTAQLGGSVGITSLHRLKPEFSGDPPDIDLLHRRLLVETIHELGHLLGLVHCRVSWCAMAPSRLPEHIDLKDAAFCPGCFSRIEFMPSKGVHQ